MIYSFMVCKEMQVSLKSSKGKATLSMMSFILDFSKIALEILVEGKGKQLSFVTAASNMYEVVSIS